MSKTTFVPTAQSDATTVRQPVTHRVRRKFYIGVSAALLLIVVIGFSRTLYLRSFFDVPAIPVSLWVHGVVLTAWFVGFFLQTALAAIHRTDLHRRLGWIVGGIGVAALAVSLAVTLNYIPRRRTLGVDIEAGIARLSLTVWADFSALLAFAVFLTTAVAFRRRPDIHKRLMLLSSMSIVSPAMSRLPIWRWPMFDGVAATSWSLGGLALLVLALVLYDLITRKRVHAVTLIGGASFLVVRIFSMFVIASSEFGQSLVRGLG